MKKGKWIGAVVFILLAVGAFFIFRGPSSRSEYLKGTISKGKITVKILSTGTVQPENRLQIKSPVAGRVDRVLVTEGQKVKKGQIIAWLSSTERAALIDAARTQGKEEIKKWEELYKPTPLVAPISGTIIQRNVEPGQTFTTSDAVLVMSDRLTVKAQVDETDLAQIHLKQKAEVTLDAYPDKILGAVVDQIAYEAKTVNNVTTYLIDVLPNDDIDYMRSGMTANVTFIGNTKDDLLLIPNEFIRYEKGKPTTSVLKEGNVLQTRELKLGITDGKVTEVFSGLELGEIVALAINKKDRNNGSPFSPFGGAGGSKRGSTPAGPKSQ